MKFTIFPGVKVNVSKSGISISVGTKGYHLNFSRRGVRQTISAPGTGLSRISYLYKPDSESDEEREKETAKEQKQEAKSEAASPSQEKRRSRRAPPQAGSSPWGFFLFTFITAFLIYLGGVLLGLFPSNLISELLRFLTQWARQAGI
jgi:hypothetical protein